MPLAPSSARRIVFAGLVFGAVAAGAACSRQAPEEPATRYTMTGQVLAIRADIKELSIKHDTIPGFMDAMTMSFRVKDAALLTRAQPGDVITSTLVVTTSDSWLETLEKTGTRPIVPESEDAGGPAPIADLLVPGDAVPDIALTSADGTPWTPASLENHATAVTFISTRCALDDYCPLMTRRFQEAQVLLASRPSSKGRARLVMISFDPEFDTAPVLRAHAASLGANRGTWTFLTGDRAAIETFAAHFGVTVLRDPADPANIAHNLRTAVVGPDGAIRAIHSGSAWTAAALVADLDAALAR